MREQFGDARLRRTLAELPTGPETGARTVADAIVRAVGRHVARPGAVAEDDRAALVFTVAR